MYYTYFALTLITLHIPDEEPEQIGNLAIQSFIINELPESHEFLKLI